MRHVGRIHLAWSLNAHVDVEEGFDMACKPAWLDGDRAALVWPFGAVRGLGHTTACRIRVSLELYRIAHFAGNLHGYIHCMPYGNATLPFLSKSMPIVFGSSDGLVPFVCRLFPLQPGYVMIVCAVANRHVANTASMTAILNIVALVSSHPKAFKSVCVLPTATNLDG